MPTVNCCYLVGQLDCGGFCLTSISLSTNTEISPICGPDNDPIMGPTIGNLSVSGYATDGPHYGCAGEAGVSINWIRKFDCDNDKTYFIFGGEGSSYYWGDVEGLARLRKEYRQYRTLNASVGNSPANLYTDETRHDGIGLIYTGAPIEFTTNPTEGFVYDDSFCGIGDPPLYLTSFRVSFPMGDNPIATYTFVYAVNED